MLDMGFQPQVDRIVRRLPAKRQTMLFSATLDGAVGELAQAYTNNPSRFEAELPSRQDDGAVDHEFVAVTNADKLDRLIDVLGEERELALVFVRTKRGADRLADKLRARGVEAAAMHGDMSQGARERALERFRSGKVTTLVATDVAARGLDLDDITPRDQLRPAGGRQGLRPPRRPNRPRRALRTGDHARSARATGRGQPFRDHARTPRGVRGDGHEDRAREADVHEPSRTPLEVVAAVLAT